MRHFFCASIVVALILSGSEGNLAVPAQGGGQPLYGYRVLNVYPHDPQAFTQGLVFIDGFLFESTGLNGRSTLRKVRPETGEVVQRREIDREYFAEGLTDWQGKLVQLTWRTGLGFVYDRATFHLDRTFSYPGEGWGLTHDENHLILSDGTPVLRFLDPDSFREVGRVIVRDRGIPVQNLNELEFVQGEVYANVWHSDRIARIAPTSGEVLGWIDLSGLLPKGAVANPEAVLNGIAYDAVRDRLFITGKLWPKLFEIRLERRR
ncbi:MAG TPA: glutaminyl-peptide cyclotransferase [Candidatus Methylomirabilis sp.]|nr:glutaminyl-peptide cyclotransferase [Candidatus Methylomirabilis sp.]